MLPLRRGTVALLLGFVLLVALVPRAGLIRFGLPYLIHWDEPDIVNRAIAIAQTGDFNPHYFRYGSLNIYLSTVAVVATYLHANTLDEDDPNSLTSLGDLQAGEGDFQWYLSHPHFLLASRGLVMAIGVAACIAVFWLGSSWGNWVVGSAAALFLALSRFHIINSVFVTSDIPASTFAFASLSVAAHALHHRNPSSRPWLLASVLLGLATSFKYNVAALSLILVIAIATSSLPKARKWTVAAAMPLILSVAFLIGTPFALLDLPAFLEDAGAEIHHYTVAGHDDNTVDPGLSHIVEDAGKLVDDFGLLGSGLALVGLFALALRVRGGWVLVSAALFQLWLVGATTVDFHRNVILLYPILALAAGFGVSLVIEHFAVLRTRRRRLAAAMVFIVWFGWRTLALQRFIAKESGPDSRSEVITTLSRLGADSPARVVAAEELRIHRTDWARLDEGHAVVPMRKLICTKVTQPTLIVLPLRVTALDPSSPKGNGWASLIRALGPPIAEHGELPTWFDRYSVRPALGVWRREPGAALPPGCDSSSTARDLEVP